MKEDAAKTSKKGKTGYINAVGRRKEAIARVRLVAGKGAFVVNGKAINQYFPGPLFQKLYTKPLTLTQTFNKYYGTIKVSGGGLSSQLGAVIHGISKALNTVDPGYRAILKKEGLLTRDARVKERRKYGHAQKARAMKQSPKR